MQEADELNPADREFEAALANIDLANPKINRDELAFALGQASLTGRLKGWRNVSLALMSALLISLIVPFPTSTVREENVAARSERETSIVGQATQESTPPEPPPTHKPAYLNARIAMLGNDDAELDEFFALPRSGSADNSQDPNSTTVREFRRELIN